MRDIHATNKAFLAKSAWRFISEPRALASRWASHKYFGDQKDWTPTHTTRSSFVGKGIEKNLPLVTDHLRWQVGNDKSINISSHFWIEPINTLDQPVFVDSLISSQTRAWNLDSLRTFYDAARITNIIKSLMSRMGLDDRLVWTAAPNGRYSSKYGYKVLYSNYGDSDVMRARFLNFPWDDFWKLKVPHKYLLFGWKIVHDAIPVADTLRRHHIMVDSRCSLCNCESEAEDRDHLFLHCSFAKAVWFGIKPALVPRRNRFLNLNCWLTFWVNKWKNQGDDFWNLGSMFWLPCTIFEIIGIRFFGLVLDPMCWGSFVSSLIRLLISPGF